MHRARGMCASSTGGGRAAARRRQHRPGRVASGLRVSRRHPGGAVGTPQGVAPGWAAGDRRSCIGTVMSGTPTTPRGWTGCCGSGTATSRTATRPRSSRRSCAKPASGWRPSCRNSATTRLFALTGGLAMLMTHLIQAYAAQKTASRRKKRATRLGEGTAADGGGGPVLLRHHPLCRRRVERGPDRRNGGRSLQLRLPPWI